MYAGTTVVQHAHRENGIKGFQGRELLDTQRQQVRTLVVTQQLTHRFKLAQEQLHRIDTDDQMRACADHETLMRNLMPWRKGPFSLYGVNINTEWRSDWKWENGAPGQVG